MTTSVPSITWNTTGITLPTDADILTGVQADMNTAFGGGLSTDLSSPQGQLAQSETAIISDKNAQIADVINNVNPDLASGRWQDAIGRIYFLNRIPGAGTVVTCTCVGAVGTVIPAGSQAMDANGYIYASTAATTIPSTGSVTITFQNITLGAIACPAGTLTKIITAIIGWDAVSNPADGVLGNDVESRADFEYRRAQSVAANAQGSVASILGAVWGVANVVDCYVIDNPTGATVTVGATNYSLPAHSLYVGAVGGAASDIANAIWTKKSTGSSTVGNTAVTVQDTSALSIPYPSYVINYNIPTNVPIKFAVQIANNANLPANIVILVQNAIIAAFNGTDGGSRARMASTIYASRYYAGIASISSYVSILSVLLGTSTATLTSVAMGIDQEPTITAANISVTLV